MIYGSAASVHEEIRNISPVAIFNFLKIFFLVKLELSRD